VTWTEFAPFLSDDFLQVTKIEYRPLNGTDLQVIKEKLELQSPEGKVTRQAFASIWSWWQALENAMIQIQMDWCKDQPKIIYGILSRKRTEDLLRGMTSGTFLLRFSENNAGALALAYVEENKTIRHTLVNVKSGAFEMKTADNIYQFATLAELVFSCKPLRMLYPSIDKTVIFQEEDDDVPH